VTTWARIAAPLADAALLPAWFVAAMMAPAEGGDGRRRGFGLLLATGDVLRVASLAAAHLSSEGTVLLDVVLDRAGVPDDVDAAWRSKHYLGAPVPGAVRATVNLAQVVAAVAFAPEPGERPERANDDRTVAAAEAETGGVAAAVEGLRRAAEDAASQGRTPESQT
jgi:hypothetical protein